MLFITTPATTATHSGNLSKSTCHLAFNVQMPLLNFAGETIMNADAMKSTRIESPPSKSKAPQCGERLRITKNCIGKAMKSIATV